MTPPMPDTLEELERLVGALEPLGGAVYADGRDIVATFKDGAAFDLATVSPLGEMAAQPAADIAKLIAWLLVNAPALIERVKKAEGALEESRLSEAELERAAKDLDLIIEGQVERIKALQGARDAFLAAGGASPRSGKVQFSTWSLDKLAAAFDLASRTTENALSDLERLP